MGSATAQKVMGRVVGRAMSSGCVTECPCDAFANRLMTPETQLGLVPGIWLTSTNTLDQDRNKLQIRR